MSIHDGALSALDISLRDKAAPKFFISRGEDDALQWQPPARSRELANALSYHYPLEHTIEEKMQRAILDFLISEFPDRFPSPKHSLDNLKRQENPSLPESIKAVGKVIQDVSQAQESLLQPSQIVQGSQMFGAWDVKTGKSVNKGRKRGLSPTTRQRVAKNRGNTCAYHRKAKTQCHPSQCRQNKLYPGTIGNSVPKETDQGLLNQKDKSTNDNPQISCGGFVTKPYGDGHLEKRSNALPSPSLSPLDSTLHVEGNKTTSYDPGHNYNDSGQDFTGNDIHAHLFSGADPSHANGELTLLKESRDQPRGLDNPVENSSWISGGNEAYPLVNEINMSQGQSTLEQFPNEWYTDFNEAFPPTFENGDTDHTDWIDDLMGADLPSLERDWPREDGTGDICFMDSSPFPDPFLGYGPRVEFPVKSGGVSRATLSSDPTVEIGYGDYNVRVSDGSQHVGAPLAAPSFSRGKVELRGRTAASSSVESNRKLKSSSPLRWTVAGPSLSPQEQIIHRKYVPGARSLRKDRQDKATPRNGFMADQFQHSMDYEDLDHPPMSGQYALFQPASLSFCAPSARPALQAASVLQAPLPARAPLTPPDEGIRHQAETLCPTTTREDVTIERKKKPEGLILDVENAVEKESPILRNEVLYDHREIAKPSIEDLTTLLQDSHLRFTGTFEQLYPGLEESSLVDIVFLDDTEQKSCARLNPEMIRTAFGTSFDKFRLLRSSCDINFESGTAEILSYPLVTDKTPVELKASTLASEVINNHTETFPAHDSFLIYIGSLLSQVSSTSGLDSGRLVTLLYRLTATRTIAKRAIVTPRDPNAQSLTSASYTLRWLDPKWRTVESIIAKMVHTTSVKACRVSSSRMLSTAPPIINRPPPLPLSERNYIDLEVEERRPSDVDTQESPVEGHLPVLHLPGLGDELQSVDLEMPIRHARRMSRRAPSAAVMMVNKPVDAVKALWTRLARVKL